MTYQPLKQKGGTRTESLRPVNEPQPTQVTLNAEGRPIMVRRLNRGVRVVAVQNHWRIDDRWWTDRPVHRHYWELELVSGDVVTVFEDETDHRWYEQRYTPPRDAGPPPT